MVDVAALAQRVIQIGLTLTESAILVWALKNGVIFILRLISFYIDTHIVNFIAKLYTYFLKILEGTMFNENVTDKIVNNIYIFIGVIVFFRLMMLIIKYLSNPDLVGDAKIGANALVKRCIIGMAGILFLPTIFDLGLRLQNAILEDNLIQQIIIPNDMLKGMDDKIHTGGKYIGTYVLAGFVSPSANASSQAQSDFDVAVSKGDLSSISINKGGFLGYIGDYEYEYFFLLSTFVLCYVLYIMFKYCLDLAVRAFKLLIYQLLAPVAMVEYMINGADDGVFKNWKTAVLSTYCMLFIRVMALWFVMFVTTLMSGEYSSYTDGSLLAENDYLLRGIIIIALLGFMMDLPKLIGQIFGLDLEQEGSTSGLLKQVGGMVKGAAMGGLAFGGTAVGGLMGVNSAVAKGIPGWDKDGNGKRMRLGEMSDKHQKDWAESHPNRRGVLSAASAAGAGMFGSLMGMSSITNTAYKGYQGQQQQQQQAEKSASELTKANESKRKAQIHDEMEEKLAKSAHVDREHDEIINGKKVHVIDDAHVQSSLTDETIAKIAGASAGAGGGGLSGQVTLNNLDIKVTGKATANYDGGLETNITGKATTNYNGDVETTIAGDAKATYNKDLNVQVGGQANANYNGGLDVDIKGPSTTTYEKDVNVDVKGPATTTFEKSVDVDVKGPTTMTYEKDVDVQVGGPSSITYDKDLDVNVNGNARGTFNGNVDTTVSGNTNINLQDVNINRNNNNNRNGNSNSNNN